jgi:hypothetical protein
MNNPLPIPLQLGPDPNQAVDTFVRVRFIASGLSALDTGRASAPTKLANCPTRCRPAARSTERDDNVRAPRSPLC